MVWEVWPIVFGANREMIVHTIGLEFEQATPRKADESNNNIRLIMVTARADARLYSAKKSDRN